ncbi:unnamed protein product [Closterium sp. NIES-65]|nr:unnamed protein product [Closterium sp. NIES-65]
MPNYNVRRAFAAGVFACFVTFLLTDPLKRSPIAHLPFEPVQHDAPPRMWPPIIDLTEKLTYAQRSSPLNHICGRPLGLRFHPVTGELFFADAYFGVFKVGRQGGLAQPVVTRVDGRPLLFANDLDIAASDENGTLYFTDTKQTLPPPVRHEGGWERRGGWDEGARLQIKQ